MSYPKGHTALVLVDPYNDFISEGGKFYPRLQESIQAVGLIPRLAHLVASVRAAGVPIFYAPHRQYRPGDFDDFVFPSKSHVGIKAAQGFALGSWGGEFRDELKPDIARGDVVATEHFTTSGFANTNLDFQLRKHGVTHIAIAGLVANTCIEATDATADFSAEALKASIEINYPGFAHEVKTTDEWLKDIQ
ncbi:hypothetical protein BOTBODRAFT_144391 [Botryobasidium botryosum FD-172 SS1]|uniref:Isochorismatase-like domain-containing protein n=1 Tax=Botryobasidium botryosum (strain FD-172 SS1) TaxID=930990 RepID=A0A067MMX6_BOTB1|nr:hypothetical protein BOTBODRAFT_144391 [Botryobasidium botryosum FD-172 SS1]